MRAAPGFLCPHCAGLCLLLAGQASVVGVGGRDPGGWGVQMDACGGRESKAGGVGGGLKMGG